MGRFGHHRDHDMPRRPASLRRGTARAALALTILALVVFSAWPGAVARSAAPPTYHAAFNGHIVQYGFSGFEPDFDRIDKVIISATLHDTRPASVAAPDATVILSAYLENFQPDTTPILPDLLHPNQTATSLGGFLHGKAALVNASGQVRFTGDLLAELFLDNSAHIIVDLEPVGAPTTAPTLRLEGIFTLYKQGTSLTVRGALHAIRALTAPEHAGLYVARGPQPTWQSVVSSLTVPLPPMMGTGGGKAPPATATPLPASHPLVQVQSISVRVFALIGMVIALALLLFLLWRDRGKTVEQGPR